MAETIHEVLIKLQELEAKLDTLSANCINSVGLCSETNTGKSPQGITMTYALLVSNNKVERPVFLASPSRHDMVGQGDYRARQPPRHPHLRHSA